MTEEVELIVPATYELITSMAIEGNFSRACQLAPKVIGLIEKTHTEHNQFGRPANIYSQLHGFYGISLGAIGRFAEGERQLDKGLSFARDLNNLISIAMIEMWFGILYMFKGDSENQILHYHSSIEYLEKSQLRIFLGPVWAWMGLAYLYSGQTEKALQYAEKGLKMHTELNIPFFLGSIHLALSSIYLELGNIEKAHVHGEKALEFFRTNNENYFEAEANINLARVMVAKHKPDFHKAREQIFQGLYTLHKLQIKPRYAVGLLCLSELYVGEGKGDAAHQNLKKAEGMFREMGMDYWLGRVQELLAGL